MTTLLQDTSGDERMSAMPFPGGIASPEENLAAIASGDVVVILDLAAGETLAKITRACRPLGVSRSSLLAWEPMAESASAMRLVAYALANPDSPRFVSEPIAFPGWVEVTELAPAELQARGGGHYTIRWGVSRKIKGGALPTDERAAQLAYTMSVEVQVNLGTGAVTSSIEPSYAPPRAEPSTSQTRAIPRSITPEPSAREVHAIGRTLFYLVYEPGPCLKARSLDGHQVIWEKPLPTRATKTVPGRPPQKP